MAWKIKEDSIKYIKYIWCILPIFMFAQGREKAAVFEVKYDWYVEVEQGCVLAIDGDSLNFEEQWMHFAPTGAAITSKNGAPVSLETLRAPFWVEISYGGSGCRVYIRSLRFLKQFEYDTDDCVIGEYYQEVME